MPTLYASVAEAVARDFFPSIYLSVSGGHTRIRASQAVFQSNRDAIAIAACILSERGFETSVYFDIEHVPTRKTVDGTIECAQNQVVYFDVRFPGGRR
jgi:hypothetical protein